MLLIEVLKKLFLSIIGVYSLFFIVCATLAPICAKLGLYELSSNCHFLLMNSCHQRPERCFWIFGYPISLCCRCYGVYIGVILASIFALLNKFKIKPPIILIMFIICGLDICLNFIFHINTGNITRFFIGIFIGTIIIYFINLIITFSWKGKNNA